MDGLAISLDTLAAFTQQQGTSLPREFHAFRLHVCKQDGREMSKLYGHYVPIALHWLQTTTQNIRTIWKVFCDRGFLGIVMPNKKMRNVRRYSCMNTTTWRANNICIQWLLGHIIQVETPFFMGKISCQGHVGFGGSGGSTSLFGDEGS